MSLENKVVLITGGGTGIGANTAQAFYNEGAKVVLNGRREDKLSQTAERIDPSGKSVAYIAGDIGQPQTGQRLAELAAVVETPLFDSQLTPEQLTGFNAFHPLGRNGQAKDITEAVLFLADDSRSGRNRFHSEWNYQIKPRQTP